MPDDFFISTRTPGSRTSTYGLADHLADPDPHHQYLLRSEFTESGDLTDGKLKLHNTDPNAHNGYLAKVSDLTRYVQINNFATELANHLYHDYTDPEGSGKAASIKAVHDAHVSLNTVISTHRAGYAQGSSTDHKDNTNQELYAHRVHTHSLTDLGAAAANHNHDNRYSPLSHDHDDRYARIDHSHNYLSESDLSVVGIYPHTVMGKSGEDGSGTIDPFDFNEEVTQGNVSIAQDVMSTAVNGPSVTTAGVSFLTIVTNIVAEDTEDDEGNPVYGERNCAQTLVTSDGVFYRIGSRVLDGSETYTFSEWTPMGGGAKDIFEVFYSTTTDTPRGAFPLWTGEWIENCKTKYPSFWSKALELRDAETGAFAYADTDPVAMPQYLSSLHPTVTTDHGSWTGETSDGSSKWMIFGDVAVGGNVDLPKLSTTQFWASLTTSGDPIAVVAYEIQSTSDREKEPLTTPTAWKLEGSNDGSSWDVLDTQQDVVWSERAERKLFTVGVRTPTPATYKTLRITFTECTAKPNSNSTMGRVNFVMEKVSRPGRKIGSINVMDEDTYEYYLKKYGEVGGFVIDEDNGRIRLPLINRFLRTIEDINDLGTVQLDELRRHAHSSIIGYMYVRPDTAASGGGCHWHDNNGELTGGTGGLETRPKNIALALYIQVYNSITATAITDLDARVGVLEQNAIMFARHDFTASQWNDNSDGTFTYTFNTNHFTSSHIYMNETGGSVLVDESVEVHIEGPTETDASSRKIRLVSPQQFSGYIITLG